MHSLSTGSHSSPSRKPSGGFQLTSSVDELFLQPHILLPLILLVSMWVAMQVWQPKKLASARYANSGEIRKGKRNAIRQMKRKIPNKLGISLCSNHKIAISDLCPAMAAIGMSGIGKTESVVSPTIDSLIDQGKTIVVLDVKGDLRRKHLAYALQRGYEAYSYPEQGINLLDLMKSSTDLKGAEETINAFHATKAKRAGREDGFFGPQGRSALATACMLAKDSPYPDFLMAFQFLSLDNFAARLDAAKKAQELGVWATLSSSGLRSVAHAKQTAAGIIGSAVIDLQSTFSEDSIPSLIKTEIPLDLDGKKIVFFSFDEEREETTLPVVTSLIDMLVKRNVTGAKKREQTFCLILDEFARARWPSIEKWASGKRSYGFFMLLGYQNNAQTVLCYSKEESISMLSNIPVKAYFKPNDLETSEKISALIGDTEISTFENKQKVRRTKRLLAASEIELFQPGEALIMAPSFKNRPFKVKIPINRKDAKRRELMEKIWNDDLEPQYKSYGETRFRQSLETLISDRATMADILLPDPSFYPFMGKASDAVEPEKTKKKNLIETY